MMKALVGTAQEMDYVSAVIREIDGTSKDELMLGTARLSNDCRTHYPYEIKTAVPKWSGGQAGEEELLSSCYWNSLLVAKENHIRTIAFPLLGVGDGHFPVQDAAHIAVTTVKNYMQDHPNNLDAVIFFCESEKTVLFLQLELSKWVVREEKAD